MRKKVFVVLVNFNDGQHIWRTSNCLLVDPVVSKIIIVDNASTDDSLTKLLQIKSSRLTILKNKSNLGFAKAANLGIKLALKEKADYVAPLNPDLVVARGALGKLLQNPADLTQFALKFKRNRKWVYDFGGKVNWFLGKTFHLEREVPVPDKSDFPDLGPQRSEDRNRGCDYVSGGATIVKKEVYEKIGFFDERYFMYFEDVDFSLRAKAAGFSLKVNPEVIIEHKLEEHRQTRNYFKIKKVLVSNLHFILAWVPWYFQPIALLYLLAVTTKIALEAIFSP